MARPVLGEGSPTVPDSVTALDLSTVPDMPTVPLELVASDNALGIALDQPLDASLDLASIPDMPTVPAAGLENASTWAAPETKSGPEWLEHPCNLGPAR